MSYDLTLKSKQVCNYFINKAFNEKIPLTPMQAIKLVYFAHAWKLGFTGKPLIDEPVEAWRYGAVIPSLYDSLKIYGSGEIKASIVQNQLDHMLSLILGKTDDIPKNQQIALLSEDPDDIKYIDAVWENYKNLTAIQMSNIIHQPNTPWYKVWNNGNCSRHAVIDNHYIEEYYKEKIESSNNQTNGE